MPERLRPYLIWLLILAIGGFLAYRFPENVFIQTALVVPLIAAAFQVLRDEAAYDRQARSQDRQFQFTIGAASHMANRAFDKHIEFCEQYQKELKDLLATLWREAETPEALGHANKLYTCRRDFAIWLTKDIDVALNKFEGAITRLGANARFVITTTGDPNYKKQRMLKIDQNAALFGQVLGLEESEFSEDYAADAITKRLRNILGTEELTRLRGHLIQQSVDGLERNS